MIHRFFDAIDATLSAIVPLLYLIGLAAGTLAYFSGLVVDFNGLLASAWPLPLNATITSFSAECAWRERV
jgi:hypothetical protein